MHPLNTPLSPPLNSPLNPPTNPGNDAIRAIRGEGGRTHLTTSEFIDAFDKEQEQQQQHQHQEQKHPPQQQPINWSQHIQPAIDTLLGHKHPASTPSAIYIPSAGPL